MIRFLAALLIAWGGLAPSLAAGPSGGPSRALPFTADARAPAVVLAQAGDSRLALQFDGLGLSNGAPGHWISLRSDQRIQALPRLNGAVGGERSDNTYQRLVVGGAGGVGPDPMNPGTTKTWAALTAGATSGGTGQTGPLIPWFVSQGVTDCLLILMINDHNTTADYPLAYMQTHFQASIDALNAAGIRAVAMTSHPHDSGWSPAWTAKQLDYHAALRDWLTQKAGTPGLIVVDIADLFIDPATGLATIASLKDNTHHTVTTAFLASGRVVDTLLPRAPVLNMLPLSNRDVFSADNPRGNLIANAMLSGANTATNSFPTAGGATINYNGVSTGGYFTCSNCTGLTITVDKATDPKLGPDSQQVTVTGTSGATQPVLDYYPAGSISMTSAPIGSVLETLLGVSVDAGSAGVMTMSLTLSTSGDSKFVADGAGAVSNPTPLPGVAWSGIQRIPPGFFTVGSSATGIAIRERIYLRASSTINLKARFRGWIVRKISAANDNLPGALRANAAVA